MKILHQENINEMIITLVQFGEPHTDKPVEYNIVVVRPLTGFKKTFELPNRERAERVFSILSQSIQNHFENKRNSAIIQ